jgi:hypothetical protein
MADHETKTGDRSAPTQKLGSAVQPSGRGPGCPMHIRSDNGPEFVAKKLVHWFATLDVKPLFIAPGSPWENVNRRYSPS